ncbi:hypothetical protein Bpfe_003585 [Biomphalaria pfeifferi]|uniref:Secreted protein n=1 Tax=Biomphalaria pfeifferi TaxID=112525 RepID=A0AAD8C5V2_BIOPF|nr:hypothetical protein Bpfe_003585 [Biomphalaria pfeifferi]
MVSLFRLVLLLAMIHSVIVSHPCDSCKSCLVYPENSLLRCNCAMNSCHGKRSVDAILKKRSFFFQRQKIHQPVET